MADQIIRSDIPQADEERPRRSRRVRVGLALGIGFLTFLLLATIGWLLVTSSGPWVEERPAPLAEQVGAGRAVLNKILRARAQGALAGDVTFEPAELDGFGALVGDMFRPDRAFAEIVDDGVEVTMSHRMIGGRWLNVALRAESSAKGFPPTTVRIGAFSFGQRTSRWILEGGRQVARFRGVMLPPLDSAVRRVAITPDLVSVRFDIPAGTGVVDEIAGTRTNPVDGAATTRIYCQLAAAQKAHPSPDFAEHVRRAFSFVQPGETQAEQNRAAFVALSMLVVATQTADLTKTARNGTRRCRIPAPVVYLQGRPDSPKHWALSAALAAALGSEPARAAGEWKELSDSLPGKGLDADDGSGFSFIDIAADRSGFRVALAAVDADQASAMTRRLADASGDQLLPPLLLKEPEGLATKTFRDRFGGIDKKAYAALIANMDRILESQGLVPN